MRNPFKGLSVLLAALLLFSPQHFFSQDAFMDSLKKVLLTQKEDTNKVNTLFALSEHCDEQDILPYATQCLALAEKLDYKKGIANAWINIGYARNGKGDIAGSLTAFQKSLSIFSALHDIRGMAEAHNNLGLTYSNQGNLELALDHYLASLPLEEKIKDQEGIATTLNNIGLIYFSQGDQEKALDFYLRGLEKSEQNGDEQKIAYAYVNIASVYTRRHEFAKALETLRKGLAIQQKLGDYKGLAYTLSQLGMAEQATGNLKNALAHYEQEKEMAEKARDKAGIGYALHNLGGICLLNKDYAKAEEFFQHALTLGRELGYPESIADNSSELALLYAAQGKYEQALAMHELFKQMSDSVSKAETKRSTLKKEMQYNFSKKEAEEKAEQDRKDAVAKEEKQRQELIIYSVSGGLLLVLLLVVFILRGYRQKQKDHRSITEQKFIIEEKQKEILDSIHYARKIQQSRMPSEKYLLKNLGKLSAKMK